MGLFSGFRKKKQAPIDARQSKQQERLAEVRHEREDRIEAPVRGGVEQKTIQPIEDSSALAAAIILEPRITEKATEGVARSNAYVFNVAPSSTKVQIARAIQDLYKVVPRKVHVVRMPRTRVRNRRGGYGMAGGGKKAYVYLKQGDSINFV